MNTLQRVILLLVLGLSQSVLAGTQNSEPLKGQILGEAEEARVVPVASGSHTNSVQPNSNHNRSVLFSQLNTPTDWRASQEFEADFSEYSGEAADNFSVPAGGWILESLSFYGTYSSGGTAEAFHIRLYRADGTAGLPGTLVYEELHLPYSGDDLSVFNVVLPVPHNLSAGDYYLSIQARQDFQPEGQWGWSTHGAASEFFAWINPGQGFNLGPDWMPLDDQNLCFQLNGSAVQTADTQDLAASFRLGRAYPNPFNPSTTISFVMGETAQASLRVYNATGQEVARLVNGLTAAGEHTASFDAAGMSTGLYFVTLESSGVVLTHKLLLLK